MRNENTEVKASEQHGLQGSGSRDPKEGARPERIPLNQGRNLDLPGVLLDTESFRYYWFDDNPQKPGRIQQALGAYWEFVTNDKGEKYTRPSGSNGCMYLMRLPLDYAKQDLELKRQQSLRTMDSEAQLGANEYAPDSKTGKAEGGQSAIVRHNSDNPLA